MEKAITSNNDNVISRSEINNVNDNVHLKISESQADSKADHIMKRLQVNDNRLFYLKVAWRLSDAVINNNLDQALKGKSPAHYFSWLCKRYL